MVSILIVVAILLLLLYGVISWIGLFAFEVFFQYVLPFLFFALLMSVPTPVGWALAFLVLAVWLRSLWQRR